MRMHAQEFESNCNEIDQASDLQYFHHHQVSVR